MKTVLVTLSLIMSLCLLLSCSKPDQEITPPTQPPLQGLSGDICYFNSKSMRVFELTTMKYDGIDSRIILKDSSTNTDVFYEWAKWSFDKNKIIFSGRKHGDSLTEIFIINKDGTGLRQVTNTPSTLEAYPGLSPNGQLIVYVAQDQLGNSQLYTCDINGGNIHQVTKFSVTYRKLFCLRPIWSSDGTTIYFNSNKDTTAFNIYSIKSDGSNLKRITTNTIASDWGPNISMDVMKIVFYSAINSIPYIFTVNTDGTNRKQLTTFFSGDPVWSPDGNYVAFMSNKDKPANDWAQGQDIYTIKADGTELTRITNTTGDKYYIDWK